MPLVLTRTIGEEIVIGDLHNPLGTIQVADIKGDKVRLVFDFPREVQVNRKELAEDKRAHGDNQERMRVVKEEHEQSQQRDASRILPKSGQGYVKGVCPKCNGRCLPHGDKVICENRCGAVTPVVKNRYKQ